MPHRADIALAHEDAVVGPDEHGAERMMPMRRRLLRDLIGRTKMGEHLVTGHGQSPLFRMLAQPGSRGNRHRGTP